MLFRFFERSESGQLEYSADAKLGHRLLVLERHRVESEYALRGRGNQSRGERGTLRDPSNPTRILAENRQWIEEPKP